MYSYAHYRLVINICICILIIGNPNIIITLLVYVNLISYLFVYYSEIKYMKSNGES